MYSKRSCPLNLFNLPLMLSLWEDGNITIKHTSCSYNSRIFTHEYNSTFKYLQHKVGFLWYWAFSVSPGSPVFCKCGHRFFLIFLVGLMSYILRISCVVNRSISNLMHISTGAYMYCIFHWGGGREPDSEDVCNLLLFKKCGIKTVL